MRTLILCLTVLILCLIPNWPSPAAAQTDTPPVVGLMVRDQFASGWWVQIQIRNDATIAAWSPNAPALDANCVRRAGEGQTLSGTNMYCWVPSFPQVYDTYWIATDAARSGRTRSRRSTRRRGGTSSRRAQGYHSEWSSCTCRLSNNRTSSSPATTTPRSRLRSGRCFARKTQRSAATIPPLTTRAGQRTRAGSAPR